MATSTAPSQLRSGCGDFGIRVASDHSGALFVENAIQGGNLPSLGAVKKDILRKADQNGEQWHMNFGGTIREWVEDWSNNVL